MRLCIYFLLSFVVDAKDNDKFINVVCPMMTIGREILALLLI